MQTDAQDTSLDAQPSKPASSPPSMPSPSAQFFALIIDSRTLKIVPFNGKHLDPQQLTVYSHLGHPIQISKRARFPHHLILKSKTTLDFSQNFIVACQQEKTYARFCDELLDTVFHYDGTDLGATMQTPRVAFALWSPSATKITISLFAKDNPQRKIGTAQMKRTTAGIWRTTIDPFTYSLTSLDGYFYQYDVTAWGETRQALDPYAISMAAGFSPTLNYVGKAAIIDANKIQNPHPRTYTNATHQADPVDFIGYELHTRDFTVHENSGIASHLRGKYLGVVAKIPYLKALGISHVQIMPLHKFYTVDETVEDFSTEQTPTAAINYNWGYDPHNYFTPEGWYSTQPTNPYRRIYELQEMVAALHQAKIGVILDVVYNHTFRKQIFEAVAPGCYYRYDDRGQISSATGAGPSLETRRKMVAKLIVASLKHYVRLFHMDGFRFDLMGFMDHDLIQLIRHSLGSDTILYGEAWELTDLPKHQAVTKSNLPANIVISAFNDTTRDAYTGVNQEKGFIQGNTHYRPQTIAGIIGSLKSDSYPFPVPISYDRYHLFADEPVQTLNYLSIHDGYTLMDKIVLSYQRTHSSVFYLDLIKSAQVLLFTSQGRTVIHSGSEIGRSKSLLSNDPQFLKHRPDILPRFHHNSYRASDATNHFNWRLITKNANLLNYVQGLIKLRRSLPALRLPSAQKIRENLFFLSANDQPSATVSNLPCRSFDQLKTLTLAFKSGPPLKTCWLAGEIHPPEQPSKNPLENPYSIRFDKEGEASITFSREQIKRFDLSGWSDPDHLQVKVVTAPATWDHPYNAYTALGNNTICINQQTPDFATTIDLSITNHSPQINTERLPYLVYLIKNERLPGPTVYPPTGYRWIMVAINVTNQAFNFSTRVLDSPHDWVVLVDKDRAGILPLSPSSTKISKRQLTIPPHAATIIATKHQLNETALSAIKR